eukprot:SAG11_NODE_11708_length_742_cov_12.640747_2_plen_56_part_00
MDGGAMLAAPPTPKHKEGREGVSKLETSGFELDTTNSYGTPVSNVIAEAVSNIFS